MRQIFRVQSMLLFLIVIFAFFLRFYRITEIPPSLSWDEVSIGYNAYSILKTGKDEHQKFMPLDAFTAYGDYKPPVAIYLTMPFVAVLGMNELSVRLPVALFSTLTVALTYFLVKALFDRKKVNKNYEHDTSWIALLSAFLLAFSPWHINLSRAGFEATISLFFVLLGIYLLFQAVQKPKYWLIAWIPFVVSIYTFNSSRYFAPLIALGVVVFLRRNILQHKKEFAMGICIALLCMVPIAGHLFSKEARLRYVEVNIFSDPEIVEIANRRIGEAGNTWWAKILYNRRIGYARSYLLHFFDHFQPEYLFIRGDGNPKFSIQDTGQMYMVEAPFLIIGLIGLIVEFPSLGLFLLYWIIAAILPAAVARETPHALRTLNSLPVWQIAVAYGVTAVVRFIFQMVRNRIVDWGCAVIIGGLYLSCFVYYIHNYYAHYASEFSGEWQYGYKQALEYVNQNESRYDRIFLTNSIGRAYMYALFYSKTDPNDFFRTKDASFDAAGFYHVNGFGKYRFNDGSDGCTGKCLFIAPAQPEGKRQGLVSVIRRVNGDPVLDMYEN